MGGKQAQLVHVGERQRLVSGSERGKQGEYWQLSQRRNQRKEKRRKKEFCSSSKHYYDSTVIPS